MEEILCEECCTGKTTVRDAKRKRQLINRLNRIAGQVQGIANMVERDAYCADILDQSAAVRAAVDSFNRELLSDHIRGCVANGIRSGDDTVVDELIRLLRGLMR